MNCERNLELIGPYVDGELDLPAALDVERHLENCPACQQAHRRIHRLKVTVATGAPYYKAPVGFADEIRKHLGIAKESGSSEESGSSLKLQSRREGWGFSSRILAIAAMLIVGVCLAGIIVWQNHKSVDDAMSHELVYAHARSMQFDHLMDVVSTDQHTVKPWFSDKLDFAPPVRDFAVADFPLKGGRLDYIGGRAVAALIYGHKKHVINCFVWPSDQGDSPITAMGLQGYSLVQFSQGGMSWHLVSDASLETLEELARELRSNAATSSVSK